jgi:hypothetical protein
VIDASKVGVTAAQLMEDLEKDQAEIGDEQTVGEVMLLAEVRGEDEDGSYTYIRYRCIDERQWVQRGMLHAALEQDCRTDDED